MNKEKEAANLNEKVSLINVEIKLNESGLAVADDYISERNQKFDQFKNVKGKITASPVCVLIGFEQKI